MEPIPETVEALEELGPFEYDDRLVEDLRELGARIREVVPACVGLSVGMRLHDVTFTMVATDAEVALLDAMQYLDGGPCVASAEEQELVAFHTGEGDADRRWEIFTQQTAAQGVGSSLTVPVVLGADIVRTYNMYAASAHAFDGHEEEVAAILGASGEGAITDGDLTFSSRVRAQAAPRILRENPTVERAVQAMVRRDGATAEAARALIEQAAARAGISASQLAQALIHLETR